MALQSGFTFDVQEVGCTGHVPRLSFSAIQHKLTIVSRRKRAANATFTRRSRDRFKDHSPAIAPCPPHPRCDM